ncbi:N-acetyltransferase 9-like protein isoform X2 [Stegodyphus dumicola]|uniref:N-acetyltransferase 9-like protein isoform X2 n=1 Tax=Stegodyphus dumicola TaxID=202533 RepID=UPI0015AC3434|nr:N-acetyltransferase 9-like protein isoform X2 [Stegodyphus dumicola]
MMKINANTCIVGSKVILVPYKEEHVEKYHSWMQNEELLELTASEPLTLEEEYLMQKSWFEDSDKCTFIVLDKDILENTGNETDSMIGDVNLYFNDQEDPRAAEIEVMIADPIHRSKGKGKEALLFMLRYGVDTLKVTKFVAKIKMKNERSLKLFISIGFTENDRSDIFQEIELICNVTEGWEKKLMSKTFDYEIQNLEYLFKIKKK